MAIKLQQFEQIAKTYTKQQYIYKDLGLDIERDFNLAPGFSKPVTSNDIKASYDLAAIKNSLTNLFNTLPGQRFLFPEYGLDLYQFLFEPITVSNGEYIGNLIQRKIETYESRVIVQKINVVGDTEQSQYNITITLEIPILNQTAQLPFVFNIKNQTFISIPTSRNT